MLLSLDKLDVSIECSNYFYVLIFHTGDGVQVKREQEQVTKGHNFTEAEGHKIHDT